MLFSTDAYGRHCNTSLSHFPCFQTQSSVIISHSWWFSAKWTQMNSIIWFSRLRKLTLDAKSVTQDLCTKHPNAVVWVWLLTSARPCGFLSFFKIKKTTQFTWIFEVLSRTRDLFGCARSPLWFSFVCVWPWHEGAGRIGQRGAGWCQLASGHMVQSHQIAITGRLWLHSDTLPLALLSVSRPPAPPTPLPSAAPFSLSASAYFFFFFFFFTRICCFW